MSSHDTYVSEWKLVVIAVCYGLSPVLRQAIKWTNK